MLTSTDKFRALLAGFVIGTGISMFAELIQDLERRRQHANPYPYVVAGVRLYSGELPREGALADAGDDTGAERAEG